MDNVSGNISDEVISAEEGEKASTKNSVLKGSTGNINNNFSDKVDLVEENFGVYYDDNGETHSVHRFTWKNKNKIQVQVINYGARITSIKMPDRYGNVNDIVLGFDDLAGYIHYKDKYFGATIGRMSNIVRNATFHINNKQYWLTKNQNQHHYNGGHAGLDQVIWTTFIDDKRVIMSYVSPNLSEGYPGDLLIRIIFELSVRNEFHIRMEAQCTQPTILNLSNLTYFNLAGHHSGSNEIYRHIVTLNCNCFTPVQDNLPTGEIMNVIHSGFDFQIPRTLGKVMGIVPKDGFNQNLCVNRGMDQNDCFVARILHPPSGRLLELYSNQSGINFSTANDFGYDNIVSMEQLVRSSQTCSTPRIDSSQPLLKLYEKVHQEVKSTFEKDEANIFKEMYDLIKKLKELAMVHAPNNTPAEPIDDATSEELKKQQSAVPQEIQFTPLQFEYLNNILKVLCDKSDEEVCEELKEVIKLILSLATVKEQTEENDSEHPEEQRRRSTGEKLSVKLSEKKSPKNSIISNKTRVSIKQNIIPEYYRCVNKIIGKGRAHYKTHGGIALQTQNYPDCATYKNFPNCVLKPGETYVHTITYKFWIRAGNPNKWIKRNMIDIKAATK